MIKANVKDQCLQRWDELKMGKKHRYIVFDITQEEQFVVSKVGERTAPYQEFLDHLPKDEIKLCVYDFEFVNKDKMNVNKLIFITWAPDEAKPKRKMILASSKELFKKHLSGIVKDYQATCLQDINQEEIKKFFNR